MGIRLKMGAVKFLTVRRCGLTWLLAVCAMVGCSEPREGTRVDELCPSNMEELVALSETNLTCVLDAMVARCGIAASTWWAGCFSSRKIPVGSER